MTSFVILASHTGTIVTIKVLHPFSAEAFEGKYIFCNRFVFVQS
jgi:hypothetical protein